MPTIELNPLAAAFRHVLQKHEAEVVARMRSRSVGARAAATEAGVEKELTACGIELDAAILEYTDQLLDLVDAQNARRVPA